MLTIAWGVVQLPDYKELYEKLFNQVSDAIGEHIQMLYKIQEESKGRQQADSAQGEAPHPGQ